MTLAGYGYGDGYDSCYPLLFAFFFSMLAKYFQKMQSSTRQLIVQLISQTEHIFHNHKILIYAFDCKNMVMHVLGFIWAEWRSAPG